MGADIERAATFSHEATKSSLNLWLQRTIDKAAL